MLLLSASPFTLCISNPDLLREAIEFIKKDGVVISVANYSEMVLEVMMISSAVGMLRLKRWGYNLYLWVLLIGAGLQVMIIADRIVIQKAVFNQQMGMPILGLMIAYIWFRRDAYSQQFSEEE